MPFMTINSSYKAMAKQLKFIILAFCWAHVRRDFPDTARSFPRLETWALTRTERIGDLYHINNQRCVHFNKELPVDKQSANFRKYHRKLLEKMEQIFHGIWMKPVCINSPNLLTHHEKILWT